jgi:hypothetical protein
MFFRGQKGSPVKFEFDIFVEDLQPWTSAHSPIPLLLTWRRGSKRSGSTKSVMPTGGRVVFNERFKLPATLFERSSGQIQRKCVTFALVEDESAKVVKISRQLATGELDLSQFGNLAEPRSTSIPLSVGLAGNNAGSGAEPTLSLRISSSGRLPSPSSIFSGRLSSGGSRTDSPQRSSSVAPESTDESDGDEIDEIDSFTDDEESPRSSDDDSSRKAPVLTSREMLLSSGPTPSRPRSASPAARSLDGQSFGSSSVSKVPS